MKDEKNLGADAAVVATAGSIDTPKRQATDDGGPAFPVLEEYAQFDEDRGRYVDLYAPSGGMTLRDYFAAKAMQALIAHYGNEGPAPLYAYEWADAMLKERSK